MRTNAPGWEDLVPRAYAAHPIRDGAIASETTYVAACPVTNCQYAVQLDDLTVAVDAVAGHAARAHDHDTGSLDPHLPPTALLTRALEAHHEGNVEDALVMIHEARERILGWVIK